MSVDEVGRERLSLSPLSRELVPYAFGAAVLCAAVFVACVPPRGVSFDFLRYAGMLVAGLALAGVASCLWSAAESAEQFAGARSDAGAAAMLVVREQFWWVRMATGLCVTGAFAMIVYDTHWSALPLAATCAALGPLMFCAAWSVAIWRVGPGSPEPVAPIEVPLSPRDLAAQAIIAKAREAMEASGLQRKHAPIIAVASAILWGCVVVYAFGAPAESGLVTGVIVALPAILATNALWGFWNEVLAQRDSWSEERDLAYMRAYGRFQTLRGLAGPALFVMYVMWLFRYFPLCRITSIVFLVAFAAYHVLMPMYLLRRFGTEKA